MCELYIPIRALDSRNKRVARYSQLIDHQSNDSFHFRRVLPPGRNSSDGNRLTGGTCRSTTPAMDEAHVMCAPSHISIRMTRPSSTRLSRSITTFNRVRPTYGWWLSFLNSHRSGLHPTCMLPAEPGRHGQNRYQNHDSHTLGTRRFDIGTDPRWSCGRCLRLDQPVVVDHTRRPGEKMKVIINHRAGNKRKHLRAQARTDMARQGKESDQIYTHGRLHLLAAFGV